jgi:hypothetical protein
MQQLVQLRGRGAPQNPRNRFEHAEYVPDPEAFDPDDRDPRTEFLRDHTRGIISRNDSPDIPFETSVNPYRGCEHGCPGSRPRVGADARRDVGHGESADSPVPRPTSGETGITCWSLTTSPGTPLSAPCGGAASFDSCL